jgi:hypothetical protein
VSLRETRASVLLFAVALLGSAAALGLIEVFPYAAYQHYRPWRWMLTGGSLAPWAALAQTIIVGVVAWRLRRQLQHLVRGVASRRTGLLIVAFLGLSLAVPTESAPRYAGEFILAGLVALVAAVNLGLAALLLPDHFLARASRWIDERITLSQDDARVRRWDRRLPVVAAVWAGLLSAAAGYWVFERVPHIADSVSYYFQAKHFAAGQLYLPAPPDEASFVVDQTIVEPTKWYGYGVPGWPLLLAAGVWLGVPWLVNPVLGGLLLVAGHALLRHVYDRGTANVAVLLLAFSPWLVFMSGELMPHPLTALLATLAMLSFERATGRGAQTSRWAIAAGLTMGLLALTRTFDAALVAAGVGLAALLDGRLRRAIPAAALAALVAAPVASTAFAYNRAVTGQATYPPHLAWSDRHWGPGVDRLGFGPDVGIRAWPNLDPLPGHGVADAILNANKNAFMSNVELFGWGFGSLAFVALLLALGRWGADRGMIAFCGVFVLGYSTYWFSGGPDLGARYWYPLIVPLAGLTVRGAQALTARLTQSGRLSHPGARVGSVLLAASVVAALTMMPWRAASKYYRYRGVGGQVRALAVSHGFDGALVFVRSQDPEDYQSAFVLNPPTLDDAATIYARDVGPQHSAAVVAHFPDRVVWLIGRGLPGASDPMAFEVIAGPLPPGTVPR